MENERILREKLKDANGKIEILVNSLMEYKMLVIGKMCPYMNTHKPCEIWDKDCDRCREMYKEDEKKTLKKHYLVEEKL